jgi:hypothetical protein
MRWLTFLLGLGAGLAVTTEPAASELPVAPMPREIRPDGSREPAPVAESPSPAEDPAVVIERIIQNSKQVGEKLAQNDTGTQTRQTQNQILKDIDALINQKSDPPPPSDNNTNPDSQQQPMNKDDNPNNQDNKSNKNDRPMGGGMDKNSGMPMNSMNDTPPRPMGDARRPRRGDPNSTAKKDPSPGLESEPMKNQKTAQAPEKKPTGSSRVTGGQPDGKTAPKSLLPFEEDVAKDVWGHLPDKLRQQMTQYYREDVTPKYSELLRLYYSSLSERTTSPAPPRK